MAEPPGVRQTLAEMHVSVNRRARSTPHPAASLASGTIVPSSARSTTSSIDSTRWNSIFSRTSAGMSSRSRSFSAGRMIARDAGAGGGEDLVLDAADREHLAAQRDLAGHGDVAMHGDLRDRREQRRGHGDAGRRAVLRDRALGDVDVDVELRVEVGIEAEQLRARANVGQRGAGRLLHHVAELAGERQVALAARERRLRSTGSRRRLRSRPGRWRGRSRSCRESAASGTWPCRGARGPSGGRWSTLSSGPFFTHLPRDLAQHRADFALQAADAGFARVRLDQLFDRLVVEVDLRRLRGPAPASASARGTAGRWRASRGACSRRAR